MQIKIVQPNHKKKVADMEPGDVFKYSTGVFLALKKGFDCNQPYPVVRLKGTCFKPMSVSTFVVGTTQVEYIGRLSVED